MRHPDEAADARHPRITLGGEQGAVALRVGPHRPELVHREWLAALTDPDLAIDDRARAQPHEACDGRRDRRGYHEADRRDDDVKGALRDSRVRPPTEVQDAQQPPRRPTP